MKITGSGAPAKLHTAGQRLDLLAAAHATVQRDYLERVVSSDKAACAEIASRFDRDYWDGDRRHGYGGYRYDGRWAPLARQLAERYRLCAGMRVLDVGCGKGYLLYELQRAVPGLEVSGVDISAYAIEHAKEEVRSALAVGDASDLAFPDGAFDLVLSLATLHNLGLPKLWSALAQIERVGKREKYVMVESYRNEREKMNLLYWQLTCRSFYAVPDWEWLFAEAGYTGDYGFIFFE